MSDEVCDETGRLKSQLLSVNEGCSAYLRLVQMISVGEREGDFDTPIVPYWLGERDHLSSACNHT